MQQIEPEKHLSETGLQRTESNRVQRNKQHKEYPRHWHSQRKVFDSSLIVFLEFYTLSSADNMMIAD